MQLIQRAQCRFVLNIAQVEGNCFCPNTVKSPHGYSENFSKKSWLELGISNTVFAENGWAGVKNIFG
jgi:hypothetical protein